MSLLRCKNLIARVIAYSSALKMLALLGSLIVLEKSPAMTAEATRSPDFEPSVNIRRNPSYSQHSSQNLLLKTSGGVSSLLKRCKVKSTWKSEVNLALMRFRLMS